MQKTILITGATDGIGLETARMLAQMGHKVLLHGRSPVKLEAARRSLSEDSSGGELETHLADLSILEDVEAFAKAVSQKHAHLDILINNAGIFKVSEPTTVDHLDVRFAVNTIAPYLLTKRLLPLLGTTGRVINLSSAAQAPVRLEALTGRIQLSEDFEAYAQSKLALTMWSRSMALTLKDGPAIISVNPGSMLASKMVKEAFGVPGRDLSMGAKILCRAALEDEFAEASGRYFDNDAGQFASPHPDALDPTKTEEVVCAIEGVLKEKDRSVEKG